MDYILMKEIYHCPPSIYEEQDEWIIELHKQIYLMEKKEEYLEHKRQIQQLKM